MKMETLAVLVVLVVFGAFVAKKLRDAKKRKAGTSGGGTTGGGGTHGQKYPD